MQLQNTLILLGLAATSAVAQANNYPECISDCIERRPTSSFCNGDETGDSLDFCTCQSFSGSLLIECMQACPEEDRAAFAGRAVPESCREALFPGVEVGDDDSSNNDDEEATTAADTATAGTATVTEDDAQETGDDDSSNNDDDDDTATVTVTENSTASPTDDAASETGSDAASPTTGGDEPSQTGDDSADASESSDADEDDDSAAMGIQIPGLLAAGGLVAALML